MVVGLIYVAWILVKTLNRTSDSTVDNHGFFFLILFIYYFYFQWMRGFKCKFLFFDKVPPSIAFFSFLF